MTDQSSNATRSSLLQRASQRDAQAWRELVDLYGPLVAHWCRRCHLDSHSAADCVQDVFSSVAVALEQFSPQQVSGSFRAWLWTITRNKLRDHFRRDVRFPKSTGGSTAMGLLQQVIDPIPIPDDELTGDLQLQQLTSRALAQVQSEFESRTWQAFWRSVVDGIATSDVAQELKMSEATVRQSRSRILRRLRQQLGDVM
jgi:RNA polymerase sigma-70 factor (ECF subfamily)